MQTKKVILNIDPQDMADFAVIAIHSNLEAYLVAYRLNQSLGCLLHNSKTKKIDDFYTRFKYISNISKDNWELIANHYTDNEVFSKKNLLFKINQINRQSLIPSLNSVDFFFKVPKSKIISRWVKKIRAIEGIQIAYEIDKKILINLENLIFE